jgi:hypothetical protein
MHLKIDSAPSSLVRPVRFLHIGLTASHTSVHPITSVLVPRLPLGVEGRVCLCLAFCEGFYVARLVETPPNEQLDSCRHGHCLAVQRGFGESR